jgi:polysaccharide deacetylase family protein (PEP-CTERM system associated)
MSVDVEDYFQTEAMTLVAPRDRWEDFDRHVVRNTERLFELFTRNNVRSTMFFLGWIAEHHPELVREAASLGHEVACHSYWHRPVFRLSRDEFREDTLRAKNRIEDCAGVAVIGYRAPSFSITSATPWAHEVLLELGFKYDSSVNPIRHGFYGNHSAPRVPHKVAGELLELPITTWTVMGQNLPAGGGAYLRVLPYALVANGVRAMNSREGQPAMIYLHPWEIDDEQPRLQASMLSRIRQYTNLDKMERKLERLIKEFPFSTIREAFMIEQPSPVSHAAAG